MSYFIKVILLFLFSIFYIGCSDSAKFTSSTSLYKPTVTGTFLDDVVQGLDYNCSSELSGSTNIDGEYICYVGDDVLFLIGSLDIGTIAAQSTFLTPYSFFPDDIDAVINLARLLQSLDEDSDANNGVITLDANLVNLLPSDVNFSDSNFTTYVESKLNITLVSSEQALTNLNSSILEAGGEVPDGGNISVADAGTDQSVTMLDIVSLDASGSWDADSSDTLTYLWRFELKPSDSNATLSDVSAVKPTFVADVNGTYILGLVVNDGTLNSALDTVTIIVANAIPIPTFENFTTNEDTPYMGVLDATDENNDTLIYIKIADPLHGSVTLDTNGSFVYTPNANYAGSDTFSYKVNDSLDDSEIQAVSISILEINDTPVITSSSPVLVNENQTSVLTLSASDIEGDTLTYSLSGTDAGSFDINTSSGVVSFKVAPDYESKNKYEIIAQVSDANATGTKDIVINIANVAEVAVITDTVSSIDENSIAGTVVGSIAFTSQSDSAITLISLYGEGNENFDISTSGTISVSTSASLDYETKSSYEFTAIATSASGDSNTVSISIAVNNVPETVPILIDTTLSISEDAQSADVVGTLTLAYSGDTAITGMSISGVGSENFDISTSGTITLSAAASLDYETTVLYSLTALCTNSAGNSNSVALEIYVNDIIDTVAVLANSVASVIENALPLANVGNVTIVDAGDSNITEILLYGTGAENFVVDTAGVITLANVSNLDYETTTIYNLTAVAINLAGDSTSVNVDISITDYPFNPMEVGIITASDVEQNDFFGSSVAVSGDYIIVGAEQESPDGVVYSGSAYLFKKEDNGTVHQIAKLTSSDKGSYDYFGSSVAISGEYIVIGAYKGDSPLVDQGNVYLFKRNSDTSVSQIAKITAGDGEDEAYFGAAVAISGNYIVVGADHEDAGVVDSGCAYVFKINSDETLTQITKLQASTPTTNSLFGNAVAISGNYIVVGSYKEDNGATTDAGAAYIFKIVPDVDVTNIGRVEASTPTASSYFGNSVSISEDTIVVGAYQETTTELYAGSVYVFNRNTDTEIQLIAKVVAENVEASAYFGNSVSVSGKYMIIGAYMEDMTLDGAGSSYAYSINIAGSSVSFISKLMASDGASFDYFGNSVSIDVNNIAIGAFNKDKAPADDTGYLYIFDAELKGAMP